MRGKKKCSVPRKYKTSIVEAKVENRKTEEELERQAVYAFKQVKKKIMIEAMIKTILIILMICFFIIFGNFILKNI